MKILGSGKSILKYSVEDIYDEHSFYVILNHFDVVEGLEKITTAPVLFFAHDYHNHRFDKIVAKEGFRAFLKRENVHIFLPQKEVNHQNVVTVLNYPQNRIEWIKNLYFYEKAQSNINYFENTSNSLLGFSSTLHSPLSMAIGNESIQEVCLYGMDLYIYQNVKRFDNAGVGGHAQLIYNANKFLLNYLNSKRHDLKIAFFN